MEIGVRVNLPGKVTEEGEITTLARNFTEFVATVGDTQIEIAYLDNKLKINSGKFKADFPTISASEFPVIPKLENTTQTSLEVDVVSKLAVQVAYAAALDESRPVLTGIKLTELDGELIAIGTDGFRLSKKNLGSKIKDLKAMIIPAKTILELSRVLNDTSQKSLSMITLVENNQVVFVTDQIELFSRVLEGNFPDVDKIIPKSFANRAVLDRSELVRGIRAAAIFARESNNIIRFKIQDSIFKILATSAASGETDLELEAETTGDGGEVVFNYKYVTDFLSSASTDRIVMQFNEATTPVQFESEGDATYLHIIMPIRG